MIAQLIGKSAGWDIDLATYLVWLAMALVVLGLGIIVWACYGSRKGR